MSCVLFQYIDIIPSSYLYVNLQYDSSADIRVTYPDITIVKQLYLQYRNKEIEEGISEALESSFGDELSSTISRNCYRLEQEQDQYIYVDDYFNTQDGFNNYDLNN